MAPARTLAVVELVLLVFLVVVFEDAAGPPAAAAPPAWLLLGAGEDVEPGPPKCKLGLAEAATATAENSSNSSSNSNASHSVGLAKGGHAPTRRSRQKHKQKQRCRPKVNLVNHDSKLRASKRHCYIYDHRLWYSSRASCVGLHRKRQGTRPSKHSGPQQRCNVNCTFRPFRQDYRQSRRSPRRRHPASKVSEDTPNLTGTRRRPHDHCGTTGTTKRRTSRGRGGGANRPTLRPRRPALGRRFSWRRGLLLFLLWCSAALSPCDRPCAPCRRGCCGRATLASPVFRPRSLLVVGGRAAAAAVAAPSWYL